MTDGAEPGGVPPEGARPVGAAPGASSAGCSLCGITVSSAPVTWIFEADPRRGALWVCDGCARTHLRAIEAKLDQAWW